MNSKKSFDHIEEKIKQAAENNLPAFDEKAWQLMEAKLDNDGKKRRPLLWWFILPLLIAGLWGGYELLKSSNKETSKLATEKNEAGKPNISVTENLNKENTLPENENINNKIPATINDANKTNNISGENEIKKVSTTGSTAFENNNESRNNVNRPVTSKKSKGKNKGKMVSQVSGSAEEDVVVYKQEAADSKGSIVKADEGIKNTGVDDAVNIKTNDKPAAAGKNEMAPQQKADDKKTETVKDEIKKENKKEAKEKNKKTNKGFYILATAGTDAGSTKLFSYSNSSITPKYGIGLGYRFNDRLSVQTGFYASNKKYVAAPEDYTIKPGSYLSMVDIQKVKAACLIYEIPLTIRIDLIRKPSLTFYGTIGSSYYMMQTEDYDYFYNYYGQDHEALWQYTGNKHLFSVLNFSVGIEKKLSNKFSLLVEPSFGIPLKGVGDGKVRLYSSALQAGIKYRF